MSQPNPQGGGEPESTAATPAANQPPPAENEAADIQSGKTVFTRDELTKLKAEQFEQGVTAERSRITGILAVGTELGIGDATVTRMINGGQSLETARELMAGIAEDLQAHSHINTTHSAGTEPDKVAETIDTAAIYAARNGGQA